jgi:hypothetical protein
MVPMSSELISKTEKRFAVADVERLRLLNRKRLKN